MLSALILLSPSKVNKLSNITTRQKVFQFSMPRNPALLEQQRWEEVAVIFIPTQLKKVVFWAEEYWVIILA